ncbi:MAG: hypothetical protein WDZ91_15785 [Paenibacillaceae bacterium]
MSYYLNETIQWISIITLIFFCLIMIKRPQFVGGDKTQQLMDHGYPLGSKFPLSEITSVEGEILCIQKSGNSAQKTLLIITTSGCSVCENLYPLLNKLKHTLLNTKVVWCAVGDMDYVKTTIQKNKLDLFVYHMEDIPGKILGTNRVPFAYYLNSEGVIQSRNVVNSYEHIINLIGGSSN